MKIGILTRNENAWCSSQLKKAFLKRNVIPLCFSFSYISARVGYSPIASINEVNLVKDLNALLVRPIGRGSLDEIIFRMNVLHKLEREGLTIINPPLAIERAVDKYYTLSLIHESGINVPRTLVTENVDEAIKAFKEFGGDIVIKPIFGSRGIGATRVTDIDVAERIFRTLRFYHHVLYIQEFLPHGKADIRAFVIGDRVVASMYRVSNNWKTNISQGAIPVKAHLSEEIEKTAVKACKAISCEIAGVDLIHCKNKIFVIEINSQPGWRGLQSITEKNIGEEIADYVISRAKK
ncbi:MAG: RimK family alpha-L-glutamate ligase [Candidatus Bathyarchaeia archaeon]